MIRFKGSDDFMAFSIIRDDKIIGAVRVRPDKPTWEMVHYGWLKVEELEPIVWFMRALTRNCAMTTDQDGFILSECYRP